MVLGSGTQVEGALLEGPTSEPTSRLAVDRGSRFPLDRYSIRCGSAPQIFDRALRDDAAGNVLRGVHSHFMDQAYAHAMGRRGSTAQAPSQFVDRHLAPTRGCVTPNSADLSD